MRDFALERYFSKWEFNAKYHMTASDIESMTIVDLLKLTSKKDRQAFENQWLGYTVTYGHPGLLEEIANTYETAETSDILCFSGASNWVDHVKRQRTTEKMDRYKHYLSISNSAPSERLTIIALRAKDNILERNRKLLNLNVEKLDAFFKEFADYFQ